MTLSSLIVMMRQRSFPGPTPEELAFDNGPTLLTSTGTMFAIAAVVVLGRCYTRIIMVKSFGKDDWTMFFAAVRYSYTDTLINVL